VNNEIEFFDSHAHYDDKQFEDDREELLNNMKKNGITKIINVGRLSKQYDFIYHAEGLHPNDVGEMSTLCDLENSVCRGCMVCNPEHNVHDCHNGIVAIGEIGLDYHWNKDNKEKQKEYFVKQIDIASNLDLPIIIHNREADNDTMNILKNIIKSKAGGVFHCCSLGLELTKEALKLGYYISFAGPITFKNNKTAKEIIEYVPIDRILIETDSPYLAPEPLRGKRNDSRNLKYIANKIAEIKQMELQDIAEVTFENTRRLFRI